MMSDVRSLRDLKKSGYSLFFRLRALIDNKIACLCIIDTIVSLDAISGIRYTELEFRKGIGILDMSASFTEGLSSFFSSYGLLIVLMVAMFAIMIIPQRRRDKKVKDMLSSLKAGDRVRTIGGIYGTIASIKEDTVMLLVGPDKVKLVFARGAIAQVEDAGVENEMTQEVVK